MVLVCQLKKYCSNINWYLLFNHIFRWSRQTLGLRKVCEQVLFSFDMVQPVSVLLPNHFALVVLNFVCHVEETNLICYSKPLCSPRSAGKHTLKQTSKAPDVWQYI